MFEWPETTSQPRREHFVTVATGLDSLALSQS
jgi:hypothetical protein